jgi:hypothetical protein
VNIDGQFADAALARFVIGGIQYVVERHLEYVMHFRGGDFELIRRVDKTHDRRHSKPRDHDVIRQVPGQFHQLGTQPDFFEAFAQRRVPGIGILRLDASAGETDLAGVILQRRRALRQQHRHARIAFNQRNQHRCRRTARRQCRPHARGDFRRCGAEPMHVFFRRRRRTIQRIADLLFGIGRVHR